MARVKKGFSVPLVSCQSSTDSLGRIQVAADYTLARLHGVIQAIMDWQDYHQHEFTVGGRLYGDPDLDEENRVVRTTHTSGKLSSAGPEIDWSPYRKCQRGRGRDR